MFVGIGYTIIVVLLLVNTYYNVLIAYALFYLFASITAELPWGKCDNKWNTEYCIATKYGMFVVLKIMSNVWLKCFRSLAICYVFQNNKNSCLTFFRPKQISQ